MLRNFFATPPLLAIPGKARGYNSATPFNYVANSGAAENLEVLYSHEWRVTSYQLAG